MTTRARAPSRLSSRRSEDSAARETYRRLPIGVFIRSDGFGGDKRILERGIRIDEIRSATDASTVVEEYPDDKPYPSRLVLGWARGRPLHLVLADPTVEGDTILVTLYEPDLERWKPGFVRRRPNP